MKSVLKARILENRLLAEGVFLLEVERPEGMEPAKAGHFFNLQCGEGLYPLLRRPVSVSLVTEDTLQFIIFIKGEGTQLLSVRKPGDILNLIGPLGNGYDLPERGGRHLVVGGGIGVAPQRELAVQLAKRSPDSLAVLMGFRSAPYALETYEACTPRVAVATEDGSAGTQGFVTLPLKEALEQEPWDMVYACGPHAMLKSVAALCAEKNVPVQLLMEERMACGIGACLVCACKVRSEETREGYENVRTCKDGPVFYGTEVIFND